MNGRTTRRERFALVILLFGAAACGCALHLRALLEAQLANNQHVLADLRRHKGASYRTSTVPRPESFVRNTKAAGEPAISDAPPDRGRQRMDVLRRDYQYALVWHRQQRRFVQRRFGPLFEELDLVPPDLERLKELLVRQLDLRLETGRFGEDIKSDDPTAIRVRQETADVEQELSDLLGPNRMGVYQHFLELGVTRQLVDDFQAALEDDGLPRLPPGLAALVGEAYLAADKSALGVNSLPQHSFLNVTAADTMEFVLPQGLTAAQAEILRRVLDLQAKERALWSQIELELAPGRQ